MMMDVDLMLVDPEVKGTSMKSIRRPTWWCHQRKEDDFRECRLFPVVHSTHRLDQPLVPTLIPT